MYNVEQLTNKTSILSLLDGSRETVRHRYFLQKLQENYKGYLLFCRREDGM